jgi:hypothetical protein
MTDFLRCLRLMGACPEWIALVRRYPTPARWWAASRRGDHMLWLAARVGVRRQDLVLAACACARLVLPHVKAGEDRPLQAIRTAERWARGEPGVPPPPTPPTPPPPPPTADIDAVRARTLRKCARLVRSLISWTALRAALAGTRRDSR